MKSKLKIIYVIYDDINNPWVGGGGAIRAYEINKYLVQQGHSVKTICGSYPNSKKKEIKDGITFVRLGTSKNYLLSRLSFSFKVISYLKKISFDVLIEDISGNSFTFIPFFFPHAIAVIQNYFGFSILQKHPLLGIFSFLYEKLSLLKYKYIISVSPELVKKFPRKKTITIPQGIDSLYTEKKDTSENFMLFVGRLDFYQKGIDILLKSLKKNIDLNIKLMIVGGGNTKRLKKMIEKEGLTDYIIYHHKMKHDELLKAYRQSYFLCLPSRYEGWPLVCLESYSQGKPVLGTEIPGLSYVIEHNKTGLKTPINAEEYAITMRKLLLNKKLRHGLGQQAYLFSRKFTWDNLAKQQLMFYKKIFRNHIHQDGL